MERRKIPRVLVRVNVELWENGRMKKKAKGFIKNISLDGMCVATNFQFPVGADLVFCLDLREETKINIYGKIIWQKEVENIYRYGVTFTELDVREKPKLYRFILVTIILDEKK